MTARQQGSPKDSDPNSHPGSDLVGDFANVGPSPLSRGAGAKGEEIDLPKDPEIIGKPINEDVNASSRQGLDEVYTTREAPEVGFKRLTLKWALLVLTVLIFVPVFSPTLTTYCSFITGELLVVAAGIMGIKYHYERKAKRRVEG